MKMVIAIPSPAGTLLLRPEKEGDQTFRFALFCRSRLPEWEMVTLEADFRERLMRHQFEAQTTTYRMRFPSARFDIIELAGKPIGRIVVNRPGAMVHVVDQAIVPELRNRGIGSAIMRFLMEEAGHAGLPVRLKVASTNDPSMRLYLRLGFAVIQATDSYLELEWRPRPEEAP